jgi:hypothetical protein
MEVEMMLYVKTIAVFQRWLKPIVNDLKVSENITDETLAKFHWFDD